MRVDDRLDNVICGPVEQCRTSCCKAQVNNDPRQPIFIFTNHGLQKHIPAANIPAMQYSIQNTVGILWKRSCEQGGPNHHLRGSIFRPVSDAEYNLMGAGVADRGSTRMDVWIATNGDGVTINHIGPWHGVTKQQEFRNMWVQCPTLSFQTSTDTQVASIGVRNDND
eukprot:UN04081